MTEASNIIWFLFEAVLCLFWYTPQFVSSLLPKLQYKLGNVNIHERYLALAFCEVKGINYINNSEFISEKVCLMVNLKYLTTVSIK